MQREKQYAKKGDVFNTSRIKFKKRKKQTKIHSVIKLAKGRLGHPQSQPSFKFLYAPNVYNKSAAVQQTQLLFCSERSMVKTTL